MEHKGDVTGAPWHWSGLPPHSRPKWESISTDVGRTVILRGPPYSGKSQALKILAAALQMKWPDQRVYYFREEPSLPRSFPDHSIVIVDQVQPSHINAIRTLVQGAGLRLVASTCANIDLGAHSRQESCESAEFDPDVGPTAFSYYLHALGAPLAEPNCDKPLPIRRGPPAPRDLPIPREIASPAYPGAQILIDFLLADMLDALKMAGSRLLDRLHGMFSRGSSEMIKVACAPLGQVDLWWFKRDSETTLRIISPLHRSVLQFAYNKEEKKKNNPTLVGIELTSKTRNLMFDWVITFAPFVRMTG
ncbi:hypothetical protein PAPYR_10004 [Paratrimastix pyriformis]|uniref:Uncharacterized protein n=1 Tax=Paratrimastix pyriformis TaxID=342808 RepID=A0ABQ8UBU3_9EUKA|nr:hypothetical protein PAPYR_10004 [Paratrimastix pyriformis]